MNFWAAYAIKLTLVALLLAALYALARWLRRARFGGGAGARLVTVVESTMLSPHLWVHVVKVGTRYLCVGGGECGVTSFAELSAEEIDRRPSTSSG